MKKVNYIALSTLLCVGFSQAAVAGSRAMAMGDVGVASASYLTAPMSNPAMLANYDSEHDNFGLLLPSVGGASYDYFNHSDREDALWDASAEILRYKWDQPSSNVPIHLLNQWQDALNEFDGSFGIVDTQAAIAMAIPNRYMSSNLFISAEGTLFSFANVDKRDFDLDFNQGDSISDIRTTYNDIFVATVDVGVAMASRHEFTVGEREMSWAFGVTPKFQMLHADNTSARMTAMYDPNEVMDDVQSNGVNVDVGMTFSPNKRMTLGVVGKNLISQSLDLPIEQLNTTYTVVVEPTYQVGLGYQAGWFHLGLDVDINARRYFEELDYERQFARIGAEMDVWRWLQFRVGYQHSMVEHHDDVISAGLGLTPFGRFGVDVAAQFGDNQVGASAQFKLTF